MKIKTYLYILAAVFITGAMACSKYDDYKQFKPDGEILYTGKVDTLSAFPGKNRIKLWWIVTDPKITHCMVYWNSGNDSTKVVVEKKGSGQDTVYTIIEGLDELNYLFSVYTYDAEGNRSVKAETEEASYGDNYRSALLNRGVKSFSAIAGRGGIIEWTASETTEVGVRLNYTNTDDELKEIVIEKDSVKTVLADYKPGTEISYTTLFLPVALAIDTFNTDVLTVEAPEISYPELDKAKFSEYALPGDVPSAWGWVLPFLWDGQVAEGRGFHTPDAPLPHRFNIDLGVTSKLHEVKLWQRQDFLYAAGNVRKFEIWGSNEPAADGSFDGWVKLMDGNSIKPSGSPDGSATQQDLDYARAGELFRFDADVPAVRYIRFNILELWSPSQSSHIMELSFWGSY